MAFLVIAGTTVLVEQGSAVEQVERIGTSERAFAGNLLSSFRTEKGLWQARTAFLTQAEATSLKSAITLGAQVTCSGDMLGGSKTCEVTIGEGPYINAATSDGLGFLRQYVLTLREV